MPIQPLYIAVHGEAGQLEAYWHLRQFTGGWLLTARLPGSEQVLVRRRNKPVAVVQIFYDLYTTYLERLVSELNTLIEQLPPREDVRPGFRPGWLAKRRRALNSRKAELICSGRRQYAESIGLLRQRGWPTPPPKALAFGGFDAQSASAIAYVENPSKSPVGQPCSAFTTPIGKLNICPPA